VTKNYIVKPVIACRSPRSILGGQILEFVHRVEISVFVTREEPLEDGLHFFVGNYRHHFRNAIVSIYFPQLRRTRWVEYEEGWILIDEASRNRSLEPSS